MSIRQSGQTKINNFKNAIIGLITSHNSDSNAHSTEMAKKVDIAQGSGNKNKNIVTDSSGNITTEAKPTIPTKTSDLTNDSNFVSSVSIDNKEDTSNKVSSWSSTTNDTRYPSEKLVKDSLDGKAASDHTHNYAASTHNHTKSQITDFPTIPSKTSDLTNDSGFLTSHQDISGKIDTAGTGLSKSGTTLNHSNSITAQTTSVFKKIKYDGQGHITGTADVTSADLPSHTHSEYLTSHQSLDSKTVTVEKQTTAESGYIATYVVKQNNTQVGSKINIPKDFLVKSATIETCSTTGTPTGFIKGDKYIDFIVNTKDSSETNEHIYLNVNDLVDAYTAGAGLELTNSNELKHSNSVTAQTSLGFKKIKYDAQGHITETADVEASDLPTHYHSQYLSSHQDISGKLDISQTSYKGKNVVVDETSGNITFENKPTASSIGAANSSHTHGDITNDGKIGSTSGKPIITTTNGKLTTGNFGSGSGQFAEGNHTHYAEDLYTTNGLSIAHSDGHDTYFLDNMIYYDFGNSMLNLYNIITSEYEEIATKEDIPTVPSASSTTPSADTTNGSIGSGTTWAKADHTHPKSTLYAEPNDILKHLTYITLTPSMISGDTLKTVTYTDEYGKRNVGDILLINNNTGYNLDMTTSYKINNSSDTLYVFDRPDWSFYNNDWIIAIKVYNNSYYGYLLNDKPTSFVTNDIAYNNIKSGESTSLTLTNQKFINDAINTKFGNMDTVSVVVTYTNGTTETLNLFKQVSS